MIILGIDPDRGYAIADHNQPDREKILEAGSEKGLRELTGRIRILADHYRIDVVRIERPPHKHVNKRPGQTVQQMLKIAVNVGENRGKTEAIYYFCCGLGLNAQYVQPVKNGTKLSAKQIERLTGWTGSTDDHARDAIVLAWVR